MPPVGFEPTISAGERPKIYASDRAATGIGMCRNDMAKQQQQFCYWIDPHEYGYENWWCPVLGRNVLFS